jgi:hypothetical protein
MQMHLILKLVSTCHCLKSHSGIMWLSTGCIEPLHLIQNCGLRVTTSLCQDVGTQCQLAISLTWQLFVSLQITDCHRQMVSNLLHNRGIYHSNLVPKTIFSNGLFVSFHANMGKYLKIGNIRFLWNPFNSLFIKRPLIRSHTHTHALKTQYL